ncbi:hypothetical protein GGGNBK_20560 [Sporosarcina sp. ANT_H38]
MIKITIDLKNYGIIILKLNDVYTVELSELSIYNYEKGG